MPTRSLRPFTACKREKLVTKVHQSPIIAFFKGKIQVIHWQVSGWHRTHCLDTFVFVLSVKSALCGRIKQRSVHWDRKPSLFARQDTMQPTRYPLPMRRILFILQKTSSHTAHFYCPASLERSSAVVIRHFFFNAASLERRKATHCFGRLISKGNTF